MTIYKIRSDKENFMSFSIDIQDMISKMDDHYDMNFEGKSYQDGWAAPNAKFFDSSDYKHPIAIPDLNDWYSSNLVLNGQAYKALSETLKEYGEFLETNCEGNKYYIFNILNAVYGDEIVDSSISQQDIENDTFMGIKKLVFKEDKLKDALIFRTTYDKCVNLYCTEKFKTLVEDAGLEGLIFNIDLACF